MNNYNKIYLNGEWVEPKDIVKTENIFKDNKVIRKQIKKIRMGEVLLTL